MGPAGDDVGCHSCRLSAEDTFHGIVFACSAFIFSLLAFGVFWLRPKEKKKKLASPFAALIVAAHCLRCALLFEWIHQMRTDLETKAYIVAYILPYSALFDILHL